MSGGDNFMFKKWSIISHQLIALCAMNKLPGCNEVFAKFLAEDLQVKDLNSKHFTTLCYFILGIINAEQRDKLIQWPAQNIRSQSKFRKGVSVMINEIQEKFPWANIKKLPESCFLNPYGHQSKVVDFISKLTNLAIHIVLNDSNLLTMHSGKGVSNQSIGAMRDIIKSATISEEELIRNNLLLLKEFEEAKHETCNKCIAIKKANDNLQNQLNNFTSQAVSEGIATAEKKIDIRDLKKIKENKLKELDSINEELLMYFKSSQELLMDIKALKNPVALTAENFGGESSQPNLLEATSQASKDLYQFFQFISSKKSSREEEDAFYEMLLKTKNCLTHEKNVLEVFLSADKA